MSYVRIGVAGPVGSGKTALIESQKDGERLQYRGNYQ